MARKRASRSEQLPCPLFNTFRSIASPIIRFCTVSTDTLDILVELCAGPAATSRIELARSTKLIKRLSQTLDPEYTGDDTWADAVGGRYSGVREATPSLVTPWKDRHLGVVYRYRLDEAPETPSQSSAFGSGSLHGLLFVNPSASYTSSPPNQESGRTSHRSQVSFDSIIEEHSAGRTNLAHCYQIFKPEAYRGRPPCPDVFPSSQTHSYIAAMVAHERGESAEETEDGTGEDWVDDADVVQMKPKVTKVIVRPVKGARAGKRPVKLAGGGLKEKGTTTLGKGRTEARGIEETKETKEAKETKQIKKVERDTEDEVAIESCDSQVWDPKWVIQRKRYVQ
ncbi:uncharacterized protein LY89DRAFT_730298 [Mollisia scopiformis]|uniref:Uncharacterized protein n=1 Tax=Mollisia scopiformis TaxID=149040 RepID=A0A194XKC5_MOLSC|nr:uncharacterized protein LY89DRAFT_730298 [Mollisia scopiformis]KUJ20242.1 hypothetical protein LY89DRAFT_730298 [Mollisia scopiformis]